MAKHLGVGDAEHARHQWQEYYGEMADREAAISEVGHEGVDLPDDWEINPASLIV
jgi:hypothetical protein